MVYFIVKVIIASIVVGVISYALRLTPRYPRRIHRILQQLLNTGLLTIVVTCLLIEGIEPGWIVTLSMIFLTLIVSIIATNFLVWRQGRNPGAEKNL